MLNKVILIGRLVKDVELRQTQNGTSYTYLTLAVNRPGNHEQTDFIDCVSWRGTAELLDKYTNKGSLIAVEGRLEVYNTESNGNYEKRVTVNVVSITFLDQKKSGVENASNINIEPIKSNQRSEEIKEMEVNSNNMDENNTQEETKDFTIDFDSIKF